MTDTSNGTTQLREENARLRAELAALAKENEQLSEQLVAAEEQGAGLVKLYVANRRLNESSDRRDALEAIQEIVISVVGCEEYAIFEADTGGRLSLVASLGVDDARTGGPDATAALARVLGSGEPYFSQPAVGLAAFDASGDEVTACVPLRAGGRLVGVIVLFALLPHKPALEQIDRTLLELLSVEAARSLLASSSTAATV
jgi:hypothetical protein